MIRYAVTGLICAALGAGAAIGFAPVPVVVLGDGGHISGANFNCVTLEVQPGATSIEQSNFDRNGCMYGWLRVNDALVMLPDDDIREARD